MTLENDSQKKAIPKPLTTSGREATSIPMHFLRIIWRGRWLLFLTIVLGLAVGLLILQQSTCKYRSTSRIYVEQAGPRSMHENGQGIVVQSKNHLFTQAALLQSTPVLTAVMERANIQECQTFAGRADPLAFLKQNLDVSVGKQDDLINTSFLSAYPQEAAEIVNAVVEDYISFHHARRQTASADVLKILGERQQVLQQDLARQTQAMLAFREKHEALAFSSENGNTIVNTLDRFAQALTEAQLSTLEAKSFYEKAESMHDDPDRLRQFVEAQGTIDNIMPVRRQLERLETRLETLEQARTEHLTQLTLEHPGITFLNKEIIKLKQQVQISRTKMAQSLLATARSQYEAALEKENELQQRVEEQQKRAVELQVQLAQFKGLQAACDQTKRQLDIVAERIRELDISEDVATLNISVLEVAQPATYPTEPNQARVLGIALVIAFLFGGASVLLRDLTDPRFHNVDEVTRVFQVPLFGAIPPMKRGSTIVERGCQVALKPKSSAAEAYRAVRTALVYSVPAEQARIVHITSAALGEGKSTLASNLAVAMAQSGERILLVDGDFRRPVQYLHLEGVRVPGISDVLAGVDSLEAAIERNKIDGLDLLPCGTDIPNPSEILGSQGFRELLQQLAGRYDRIIVDGPPISQMTDSPILAAVCDVTVLVFHAGKCKRQTMNQARQVLAGVNAKVIGLVANVVSRQRGFVNHNGFQSAGRR